VFRCSNGNESESFGSRSLAYIMHVDQTYLVASPDEFTTKSAERMNMAGDGWADNAEMHALAISAALTPEGPRCPQHWAYFRFAPL